MDSQDALHAQARQALTCRDLTAFRKAINGITDIDRKRDTLDLGFRSLLIEAAEAGATDFVIVLLGRGAAINQADTYRGHVTSLQYAAQRGHLATIRTLVEHGANLNAQDQWGYTALWYAATCHGGHRDIVDFLLRSGADPALADSEGRTPLDWATMNSANKQNREVVAMLRAAKPAR
jgi:ankyrin repeat protein